MSQSTRMPDTHAEAWAMLPFLANGRISAEDREWVESHVHGCADCSRELEEQRAISSQMRDAEPSFAGNEQRAFAKLWTRIEASEGAIPAANETSSTPRSSPRAVRWLAAAVIVQAVGLAALGFVSMNRGDTVPNSQYATVADAPVAQPNSSPSVRLKFAPDTSIEAFGAILASHGLEVISGPGEADVFTAALPAKSSETPEGVAKALSADPRVLFAQPVVN